MSTHRVLLNQQRSPRNVDEKGDTMDASIILKDLRGDRSQSEMAAAVGVTKSAWAMYERGERVPRDEVKRRIAAYFGKSVQEIFFA